VPEASPEARVKSLFEMGVVGIRVVIKKVPETQI
jgi:hypothetical protein